MSFLLLPTFLIQSVHLHKSSRQADAWEQTFCAVTALAKTQPRWKGFTSVAVLSFYCCSFSLFLSFFVLDNCELCGFFPTKKKTYFFKTCSCLQFQPLKTTCSLDQASRKRVRANTNAADTNVSSKHPKHVHS